MIRDYRLRQFVALETGKGAGAKMGSLLRMRWSAIRYFFSLSPVAVSEVFLKVNSAKFPSCFLSGESKRFSSLHRTFFAISKEYILLAFRILYNLLNISTVDYIHSSLKPDVSDTAGNEC